MSRVIVVRTTIEMIRDSLQYGIASQITDLASIAQIQETLHLLDRKGFREVTWYEWKFPKPIE